jgi:tetratricopeptide (TPR) repeat protein
MVAKCRFALCVALVATPLLAEGIRTFELNGSIEPHVQASVSLHGTSSPFSASTLADVSGHFHFHRLTAGQYTLSAFAPGHGERRFTIDIGSSSADAKGRFAIEVRFEGAISPDTAGAKVSVAELAIPDRARKQYMEAQKCLAKRDVDGAIDRLKRAIEFHPPYVAAWNNLGTIAYQTQRYPDAEKYFREALTADPSAFEPLVNLGGVLLTLDRIEEAYHFNLHSVLKRPQDALANSQMGMTYFAMAKFDLAEKYLLEARRLDASHFSHPQLLLAEIYLRRHDGARAAAQLEEFVALHPDWPAAPRIREVAAKLRASAENGR